MFSNIWMNSLFLIWLPISPTRPFIINACITTYIIPLSTYALKVIRYIFTLSCVLLRLIAVGVDGKGFRAWHLIHCEDLFMNSIPRYKENRAMHLHSNVAFEFIVTCFPVLPGIELNRLSFTTEVARIIRLEDSIIIPLSLYTRNVSKLSTVKWSWK